MAQIWPFWVMFFFVITGSLVFIVGGDTVISSGTWKRESQTRYDFNLCRIFTTTKKDLFLLNKWNILAWDFFSTASFFFPPQWETYWTQVSNAFSFCNFVYWFSIYVYIGLFYNQTPMAWAILYLKLEATFLIGITLWVLPAQ